MPALMLTANTGGSIHALECTRRTVAVMTAQPVEHQDPLDPQRILEDLPAAERLAFAAEYRRLAEAAINPAQWEHLHRYLRRMRYHADAAAQPGYAEAAAAAHRPDSGGMPLEEAVRRYRPAS